VLAKASILIGIRAMPSQANLKIARGARLKAEADFATWLMLAKLGSFDELPEKAQTFLTHYQERLKTDGEKSASSATIAKIAAAYYVEMGGTGDPPENDAIAAPPSGNVVELRRARESRGARSRQTSTAATPSPRLVRKRDLLIFAGLVVLVIATKYFVGSFAP